MTLYEFNALDEMEQAEAVWEKGVHVADREDGLYRYILYQLDAFYVEVWYHREYNIVRKYRSFINTEQLSPYLQTMKLDFDL